MVPVLAIGVPADEVLETGDVSGEMEDIGLVITDVEKPGVD